MTQAAADKSSPCSPPLAYAVSLPPSSLHLLKAPCKAPLVHTLCVHPLKRQKPPHRASHLSAFSTLPSHSCLRCVRPCPSRMHRRAPHVLHELPPWLAWPCKPASPPSPTSHSNRLGHTDLLRAHELGHTGAPQRRRLRSPEGVLPSLACHHTFPDIGCEPTIILALRSLRSPLTPSASCPPSHSFLPSCSSSSSAFPLLTSTQKDNRHLWYVCCARADNICAASATALRAGGRCSQRHS